MLPDVPLDGYSPARRRIIIAFECLRTRPDVYGTPINRRVARIVGLTIDCNGSNSFVARVLRDYLKEKARIAGGARDCGTREVASV